MKMFVEYYRKIRYNKCPFNKIYVFATIANQIFSASQKLHRKIEE